MAVTVTTGIQTPYDSANTLKYNIDDQLDIIDPRDIPLLALLGWGQEAGGQAGADSLKFQCTSTTHTWQNDQLIPSVATLGSAYTSGDNEMTMTAGEELYFKVDDVIICEDTHYRVTEVDDGNNKILLALVSTSDAAHVNSSYVYNLGKAITDGEQYPTTGKYTTIGSEDNYTQIFSDTVAVSGTEQAVAKYGIDNELEYQTSKKFAETVIKMERDAIYGLRSASLPTSNVQPARRMGGLYHYIRSSSTANRTDMSSKNLATNESSLISLLDDIYAKSGSDGPDTILVNTTQYNKMREWLTPYVRTERTEKVAGILLGQYQHHNGILDVVLNRYLKQSDLIAINKGMLGIGPLKGAEDRTFKVEDLPKDGDYYRRAIIGEYTMEVRNPDDAHGWMYSLPTT